MAVVKTYLGAVKPIGEKIVLQYTRGALTATDDSFDFVIDQNYCVTNIEIVKTGSPATNAGDILTATVSKIATDNVTPTLIGQAALASSAGSCVVGAKNVAGTVSASVTIGAGGAGVANSYLDPTVLVAANVTTAGTSNSKQKLQLRIKSIVGGAGFSPSCTVIVEVARYNSLITQGTAASLNGIQAAELLTPPTA